MDVKPNVLIIWEILCAAMSFKTIWVKYYDFTAPFPTTKKHVLALSDYVGIAPSLWAKQQKMRMRVRLI